MKGQGGDVGKVLIGIAIAVFVFFMLFGQLPREDMTATGNSTLDDVEAKAGTIFGLMLVVVLILVAKKMG